MDSSRERDVALETIARETEKLIHESEGMRGERKGEGERSDEKKKGTMENDDEEPCVVRKAR